MKAIFIYPNHSSFIKVDESIFRQFLHLKSLPLNQSKGKAAYFKAIIKTCLILVFSFKTKLSLTWFADYHAFPVVLLSKLLRKKSVVFIGGFDAVSYPEYGYGVYQKPLRRFCASFALKNCSLIIANHQSLLKSSNTYYQSDGHKEGILNLITDLRTEAIVIENCITGKEPSSIPEIRTRSIMCVGSTPRIEDFYNKGYDLLIEVAKSFETWQFVFVGISSIWMPYLEAKYHLSLIPNIRIIHALPHAEVLKMMSQTDIYVQASISEGMPNALMEAMLYGCKVIGSNVAGIPTIIGKHGLILQKRDAMDLKAALKQLMDHKVDREAISKSIVQRFSYERRSAEIRKAIQNLI
jgi:glycosyltransferase involved in cell wall biosynthesis